MQLIPLSVTPNQSLSVQLAGANYQLHVFQNTLGVFLTLSLRGQLIVASAPCRDRVRIVRDEYLGFPGDLTFFDTQGTDDPDYAGFGVEPRFVLAWIEPGDEIPQ